MNSCYKYFSACLLALVTQAAFAQSAPTLGAASEFAVLGGTAVTCTTSVVAGDVGISPGTAFTNTGCTISGDMPPATNADAAQARAAMLSAYAALQARACTTLPSTQDTLSGVNLAPGVYCISAVAKTGLLTLTGPQNGVWIFLVAGALTGTNFSVAMAGGGMPCNVFWAPTAAATMTTSALKGNIVAGNSIGGSITLTGGSLVGRALASVAVTMTNASVIDCDVVADFPSCKGKKHHGHHGHDHDKGHGHSPFDKHDDKHDGKDDKDDKHDGKDGKDDNRR